MSKLVSIQEAAKFSGVSTQTLRRWEREGKEIAVERTKGGQRRYDLSKMRPLAVGSDKLSSGVTIAYARVSSHDQKEDLQRQEKMLEMFCSSRGWTFEILSDLGSGMNYHKRGLRKLLARIMEGSVGRLVLTHKDRLLRFGAELVFAICEMRGIEIILINQSDEPSFEEELTADVLEIITVFSARLYGSRSRKNKKLLEDLQEAVLNGK
jgi:predicted site-specific integrase-resolvase